MPVKKSYATELVFELEPAGSLYFSGWFGLEMAFGGGVPGSPTPLLPPSKHPLRGLSWDPPSPPGGFSASV